MKTITYEVREEAEALEALGNVEEAESIRKWAGWDRSAYAVVRCEDGQPVEILGTDGGEQEDQTLSRDWSWVVPALRAAYELGLAQRNHEVGS